MFLSIDAGNSNIVFGFFDPSSGEWRYECRVETAQHLSAYELGQKLGLFFLENNLEPADVSQIGISSVVPEINTMLEECCKKFFGIKPYLINGRSYEKLKVATHRPNEIGSDLMSNVTAAYEFFGESCIIVDFGTALTFSVVDGCEYCTRAEDGDQSALSEYLQATGGQTGTSRIGHRQKHRPCHSGGGAVWL
jgi:type III pantothenate kinase